MLWTIGYDTIYAHQDKEDDQTLGLKSSALRLGSSTQAWLVVFYGGAVLLWTAASFLGGAHVIVGVALAIVAVQLAWQVATLDIDDPGNCLERFRSNCLVGWIFFAALVAEAAVGALR